MLDVIQDPSTLADADARIIGVENHLPLAEDRQRRVHQAGVIAIDFRRVGLFGQRYDFTVRQPLESLIANLAQRREHLCVIAVLKKYCHARFEGRRKRVESWKVAMVRMLVREPYVVDLVEHRLVELRLRQQAP